ncbi:ruBisCO-associated protein-like [Neltuma alba]|uniref:ruBisCO-associated protein-like n=1 Tax=Neltuma alba TaxID=207710 RepID=UPI0010A57AE6|nr:ruBisCO-associated protein-like [Prosopis alba]XP_028795208.1 ruBisCO-associated protein-like [Prosopis alba]
MPQIFRQYTYDDSFLKVFVDSNLASEYQIALIFARDYDELNSPTNGIFNIFWDKTKVTPSSILQFRERLPVNVKLKVFISIGDRDVNFRLRPLDTQSWISNATNSLTSIIRDELYALTLHQIEFGLDVFYEHIDDSVEPNGFAQCMGQLIKNLKAAKVITAASISPSASLSEDYYSLLNRRFCNYIDLVDYQFQNEITSVDSLVLLEERFSAVSKVYPQRKLLAGYSAENEDWTNLSPIVFFLFGYNLFKKKEVAGFSILYHDFVNPIPSPSSDSPP